MKFVCMRCEDFMIFQKSENVSEGSMGVMFECPKCGSRFSMVTNPGETSLVHALGVKIGGRTQAPEPFELTRETLKEPAESQPTAATVETGSGGSCPFSAMLSGGAAGQKAAGLTWSAEAEERLQRIPDFLRPMIKAGIESYATKMEYRMITPAVMDESKNAKGDLEWTPEAERRLQNIPEFIRPMARKEIERLATEKGQRRVTEAILEDAKGIFTDMGYNTL
jgi:Proto-chlorophyllide reductase 57 kD subunit